MLSRRWVAIWGIGAAALSGFCALAWQGEQDQPGLTARQLYYKKKPTPAAAKPDRSKKKVDKEPDSGGGTSKSKPVGDVKHGEPGRSDAPQAAFLGIRYSLVDAKTSSDLDPRRVFHNGDQIRVRLASNTDGYLYVLNKDPHGEWTPLFPSAQVRNNDNRIQADGTAEIPSKPQTFDFAGDPGSETLFVVLSKQREPSMDKLIDALRRAAPDGGKRENGALLAQNRAGASNVQQQMDRLTSRSLKVGEEREEKAVYVAASAENTTRIVTQIVLEHR